MCSGGGDPGLGECPSMCSGDAGEGPWVLVTMQMSVLHLPSLCATTAPQRKAIRAQECDWTVS